MVHTLEHLLRSHRSLEQWTWDLLDNDDNVLGPFKGVVDGSLKYNIAAPIRTGGTLTWKGLTDPEWAGIRLRPTYHCRFVDGTMYERNFGVYIPATPEPEYNGMYITAEVEFYDKLLVLSEDAVDASFGLPAGTVVTTAIRDIIVGAGETKHSIADSTATLVNAMVWKPATPKLKIINELLDVINYFSLWCDDAGFYRGEPYVPPQNRGLQWDFKDGETSIYQPRFKHKQDYFGKPNKVILISQGNSEDESMISVATNTDPTHPLGYGGIRGERWVTYSEEGVEAPDQITLDGIAERRLWSLSDISSTFEIKHPLIPLDLNGLVSFISSKENIDARGVVQEMTIPCVDGKSTQVDTFIREVK